MSTTPLQDPWRLDDRCAVVTGASSGIGAAVARELAGAGANVVLVGRDEARLASVAAELGELGRAPHVVKVDVTDGDAPAKIVAEATEAFGSIHVLVHAAGIFALQSVEKTSAEDLDQLHAVHVRAPFLLTQAALGAMAAGSSVVFVGSNLAHHGLPWTAAYSASKAATEVMARTMAVELGPSGIRVNTVSPGVTRTPMTQALTSDPEATAGVIAVTPVGRLGEPEDIARAVRYLSSDASAFVAGASLLVDGGQNAR